LKNKVKKSNPYAHLQLRQQIYLECRAMAEFALAKGRPVPAEFIATIECFVDDTVPGSEPSVRTELELSDLVSVHNELSNRLQPATPQTILLLDIEQEAHSWIKFLGPVGLVRQLMIATLVSLAIFVGVVLSPAINDQGGNIFTLNGLPLFLNLLFFLSAAGLGASFSGLYTANKFITAGVFDPTHKASYWIRFLLGLVSGLMLAVLISEEAMAGHEFLEDGVIRPLLAIVGGFSADLLYTLLNRMVETLKSLFQGSASQQVENETQAVQMRFNNELEKTKMGLQQELVNFQQELDAEGTSEAKDKLQTLMKKLHQ